MKKTGERYVEIDCRYAAKCATCSDVIVEGQRCVWDSKLGKVYCIEHGAGLVTPVLFPHGDQSQQPG